MMSEHEAQRDELARIVNDAELQQLILAAFMRQRLPRLCASLLAACASETFALAVSVWLYRQWSAGGGDWLLFLACVNAVGMLGTAHAVGMLLWHWRGVWRTHGALRRFVAANRAQLARIPRWN